MGAAGVQRTFHQSGHHSTGGASGQEAAAIAGQRNRNLSSAHGALLPVLRWAGSLWGSNDRPTIYRFTRRRRIQR